MRYFPCKHKPRSSSSELGISRLAGTLQGCLQPIAAAKHYCSSSTVDAPCLKPLVGTLLLTMYSSFKGVPGLHLKRDNDIHRLTR